MKDLKNRLKNRRLELNLTQAEVAKQVGVSEGTISRWESGNIANMKRSYIAAYAKVLKLKPSAIMGISEDETEPNSGKLGDRDEGYSEALEICFGRAGEHEKCSNV